MFMIAAVANNGAIGKGNQLPWRSKEDLQIFKRMTTGKIVVMGRKTAESLGKPLPDRVNVVISRDAARVPAGFSHMRGMPDVAKLSVYSNREVAIIGGAEVYRLAMPYVCRVYLTHLDVEVPDADTFFPMEEMAAANLISLETLVVQEETETTPAFKQVVYGDKEWIV